MPPLYGHGYIHVALQLPQTTEQKHLCSRGLAEHINGALLCHCCNTDCGRLAFHGGTADGKQPNQTLRQR